MSEEHNQICGWCEEEMNPCPDKNCLSTQDHDLAGVFCSDTCADNWCEANEEDEGVKEATRLIDSLNQAQRVIQELIEWNAQMGSFDAPAWRMAHQFRHQHMKGELYV